MKKLLLLSLLVLGLVSCEKPDPEVVYVEQSETIIISNPSNGSSNNSGNSSSSNTGAAPTLSGASSIQINGGSSSAMIFSYSKSQSVDVHVIESSNCISVSRQVNSSQIGVTINTVKGVPGAPNWCINKNVTFKVRVSERSSPFRRAERTVTVKIR